MFLCSILTLAFASCLVASSTAPSTGSLPPSRDPWYTAPSNYESTAPGTVLRLRPAPGNLTAAYSNSSAAYNVLYRTTDSNYKPAFAVTTLFIPRSSTDPKNYLVSYQIPYNSPSVDASPSNTLANPEYTADIVGTDISALLHAGYFVSVPDHEGPLAAFVCSVSEGHATLDAVRAVLSLERQWTLTRSAKVMLWGYSGGSIASEFAAELQVQYAPELSITGVAIGGLPTNITSSVLAANKSPFAGLLPAGLVGVSKQHPAFNQTLRKSLKQNGEYNASTFLAVATMDVNTIFAEFAGQDMAAYFTDGFAIFESPEYKEVANTDAIMGYHGVPQMPLFVYKAVHDELCPIAETDALVERYCGVGANILYQKNSVGGHLAEETNGDASALAWIGSVLEGTYNHTGCSVQSVALNVTDSPL